MKISKVLTTLSLSVITLGISAPVWAESTQGAPKKEVPIFRLYNKNTGEHFYTPDANELIHLQRVGWTSEGIGWYAPQTGMPVYRIYNSNAEGGDHYYTRNKVEAQHNVSLGWKWDNNGVPVFYSGGKETNYVAYNPNAKSGAHNYTTNTWEQEELTNCKGWIYGAKAWQAEKVGTNQVNINQVKNKDLTTLQGLWRNSEGREIEVVGNQFLLNGVDINEGLTKNIWDNMVGEGSNMLSFVLQGEVAGAVMEIIPAGERAGLGDKSDTNQARIYIGQDANPTSYFYKVG